MSKNFRPKNLDPKRLSQKNNVVKKIKDGKKLGPKHFGSRNILSPKYVGCKSFRLNDLAIIN